MWKLESIQMGQRDVQGNSGSVGNGITRRKGNIVPNLLPLCYSPLFNPLLNEVVEGGIYGLLLKSSQRVMHRSSFKMRRSLGKAQKENLAEILNNLDKDSSMTTLPSLHFPCNTLNLRHIHNDNKKTKKLPILDVHKTRTSKSTHHLSSCLLKPLASKPLKQHFNINELENNNLVIEYSLLQLQSHLQRDHYSNFLQNHEIKSLLRAKMVDWMIEVLTSYKCSNPTFFSAVQLMDDYLAATTHVEEVKSLHLLGVSCMFMVIKMEEVVPIRLKSVYEKIGHKKLSMEAIKKKEEEILKAIDFRVLVPTLYDLITLGLHNWNLEAKVPAKEFNQLLEIAIYLGKVTLFEYKLVSEHSKACLSAAVIHLSLKMTKQLGLFTLPLQENTSKISELLGLSEEGVLVGECMSAIHELFRNFESCYPQLSNLKRFNKLDIENKRNLF